MKRSPLRGTGHDASPSAQTRTNCRRESTANRAQRSELSGGVACSGGGRRVTKTIEKVKRLSQRVERGRRRRRRQPTAAAERHLTAAQRQQKEKEEEKQRKQLEKKYNPLTKSLVRMVFTNPQPTLDDLKYLDDDF